MGKVFVFGGGGGTAEEQDILPVLNPPTVTLTGRAMQIKNPSTNGNFSDRIKVYANDSEKGEGTDLSYDLYTYFDEDGTYSLYAKCAGDKFQDSLPSNAVSFTKYTPQGGVVWSGYVDPLSAPRYQPVAGRVGNYILFIRGSNTNQKQVDVYDSSLTHTVPTLFSATGSTQPTAVTLGDQLIVVGVNGTQVYVFSEDLTSTFATELPSFTDSPGGAVAGENALFAGGQWGGKTSGTAIAYNKELVQITADALPTPRYNVAAASAGKNVIISPGLNSSNRGCYDIDAYDETLARQSLNGIGYDFESASALTFDQYAMFTGGYSSSAGYLKIANTYDGLLTRTSLDSLSVEKKSHASVKIDGYAIVAGGIGKGAQSVKGNVDVFDLYLTKSVATDLGVARYQLAAGEIGGFALFAGGDATGGVPMDSVEVFTIQA